MTRIFTPKTDFAGDRENSVKKENAGGCSEVLIFLIFLTAISKNIERKFKNKVFLHKKKSIGKLKQFPVA